MKKNSLIIGILISLIFFGSGYIVSRLIWKYVDKGYAHGPGLSHLFLLLLFFFCVGWMVRGFIKRKDKNLGLFWTGSAGMSFCLIVLPIIYLFTTIDEDTDRNNRVPEQTITIEKDDTDTVIYRKLDSSLIDRTKEIENIGKKDE